LGAERLVQGVRDLNSASGRGLRSGSGWHRDGDVDRIAPHEHRLVNLWLATAPARSALHGRWVYSQFDFCPTETVPDPRRVMGLTPEELLACGETTNAELPQARPAVFLPSARPIYNAGQASMMSFNRSGGAARLTTWAARERCNEVAQLHRGLFVWTSQEAEQPLAQRFRRQLPSAPSLN
jgi:hypothetical protein